MSWYQHWFADELYMELYSHRDAAEARKAVDLFETVTGLSGENDGAGSSTTSRHTATAAPLLDLACGTGRHAFELARRRFRVVAADLSPTLLAAAARKTQRHADRLFLVRADMRRLPFRHRFSAVLQLFTAFGYFRSDAANEAVIAGVHDSLLPDGWYMLDFLNAESVASTLAPRSEQRTPQGCIIQERSIRDGRVEKRIRIRNDGREREFTESVRLYTLSDFERMYDRCGFELSDVRGDYDGVAFDASSPRCIMFARRTERP
jgi:SAM-dependent methyltransferase